jgi:hypothetical protein
MSHRHKERTFRPLLSVLIIIGTLLSIVFIQMEERRNGYELLLANRELKKVIEEKRSRAIQLSRVSRPQQIERVATSRLTLKKIQNNQIIHL